MMRTSLALLVVLAALGAAQAEFAKVALPIPLNGVEPVISDKTMDFHYNTHYAGYVKNLNAAYGTRKVPSLTESVRSVGVAGTPNATALQRQGGGAWNHALYFKTMAKPDSAATKEAAISPALAAQIKRAFGSFEGLKTNMSATGMGVFGSGWAWLCVDSKGGLLVTQTANQDNPLMGTAVSKAPECTPILGIDVWEHAYYADRGPARKAYVDAYWGIVNWPQVSANYQSALAGKVNDIVA